MKLTREIKTGILAIAAIALLIFGYSFLKGQNLLENDRTFCAIYDNVEGLIPSSPVTINGLVVGQVIAINFANERGKLIVKFNVNNDFSFSKNSFAKVYGGGLIGGKSLAIVPVYDQSGMAKEGDTLKSKIEAGLLELVNDRLTPLQEKLENVITDADTVFKFMLSDRNKNNIEKIIDDLKYTAAEFKNTSGTLNTILTTNKEKLNNSLRNFDQISNNVAKLTDTLSEIKIKSISDKLEKTVENFENISRKLNENSGTLGKLANDEKLYKNLEQSSKQLELLLEDLRLHPKRYVHFSLFGKNNKPYTAPSDLE